MMSFCKGYIFFLQKEMGLEKITQISYILVAIKNKKSYKFLMRNSASFIILNY